MKTVTPFTESLPKLVLGGATLVFLVLLLRLHFGLITAPVPIDVYEPTMLAITHLIASGHIPYTAANQPVYMFVYPPLYNLLMAPLALAFGNTFLIHRLVAALFIGVACWLCYFAARRKSVPKGYAATMVVLLYATWLFYATPVSSPNSLGLSLFLASVIVPWARNFSWPSLGWSIALGVLAFYAKQYYPVGMAYIALYLFLFESKLKGFKYGLLFAGFLMASLALVNLVCPYFIDDVIVAERNTVASVSNLHTSLDKLTVFARTYSGLLAIVLLYLCSRWLKRRKRPKTKAPPVSHRGLLHGPLISRRPEFFTFCFICSTGVAGLYLGSNPGNYMSYLLQLMSPFLMIAAFGCFARDPGKLRMLFAPLLIWCLYSTYTPIHHDFFVDQIPWTRVNHLIANHSPVFATNFLVGVMLAHDKKLFTDGQTNYYFYSEPKFNFRSAYHEQQRIHLWSKYTHKIRRMVETGQFELLLLTPGENPIPFLNPSSFYRRTGTLTLPVTNRRGGGRKKLIIWRPKKSISSEKDGNRIHK